MKVKIFSLKILIVLFTVTIVLAQDNKVKVTGCSPIVAENASLYISYEGIKESARKQKPGDIKILLRLHNNTNCSIEIVTSASYATIIKKDGGVSTDMPQDSEVKIGFGIETPKSSESVIFDELDRDISISELPPGHSVLFSIPYAYFERKQVIYVPYKYNWEIGPAPDKGTIVHRIYFENSKLPEKLFFKR